MNFNNDEKDVLFLSLNATIKDYEVWNRIEDQDKYHFLTAYKKIAENNNSQFNIRYKLLDILKDYDEEYIWEAVFIVKPIVESHEKIYGPNSLREPDVTFKQDEDPHAWRGK